MTGKCHLCHKTSDIQDSHVWPKFAYKRYVTEQDKGGRFVDVIEERYGNRQFKQYWFCSPCEQVLSKDESYVARMCDEFERNPKAEIRYDGKLLRFAASMSWRTMKYHFRDRPARAAENRWEAYGNWKRFLRSTRGGVGEFTQHVFLLADNGSPLRKALGGSVQESVVITQIGPLLFAGQLDPEKLTDQDKQIWRNTQIQQAGIIRPLTVWKLGNPTTSNVTEDFAKLLKMQELWVIYKAKSFDLRTGGATEGEMENA